MILKWLFTFLIFYLLYKLIFNFILPVSRATSQVRNKINEMNRQQAQAFQQQQGSGYAQQQPAKNTKETSSSSKPPSEDYIDFEEIK